MKPILSVFILLTLGFTSGCVTDGAGGFPLPIWYNPPYVSSKPTLGSHRWSDQKKIEHQNSVGRPRGYSGPEILSTGNPNRKVLEGTYKDGKWEGLWTGWHYENGQKMFEGTYKKGEKVSAKYWNINGEEVETLDEAQGYTR